MWSQPVEADAPCAYEVIGEHVLDPLRLLVWGEDGQFYALHLTDGHIEATGLNDHWVVDTCELRDKMQRFGSN